MKSDLDIQFSIPETEDLEVWPLAMHCRAACNLVIWKATERDDVDFEEARKIVARLMDRLADLMHDFQSFGPLVAIIEVPKKSTDWSQLMGDQDWHRGRFVMQEVKAYLGQSIESVKERWLGPLHAVQYTPRKITRDDFFSALATKLDTTNPPKGADRSLFNRYADNLISAIKLDRPSIMSALWETELAANINDLLGKVIVEGSSVGEY